MNHPSPSWLHENEARARWGDTAAYRESRRRTDSYGELEWATMTSEQLANLTELTETFLSGVAPDSLKARAAAEAHRLHIDRWFYPCSHEMHCTLGDMYVADPRFTAFYDDRAPGLTTYLRDAIYANAVI